MGERRVLIRVTVVACLGWAIQGCVLGVEASEDGGEGNESDVERPDVGGDETATEGGADEGGGCLFAQCGDVPPPIEMCDALRQDCPPGEKCTAAAIVHHSWDANVCVPVVDEPSAVGETCSNIGEPRDGHDTCEVGAICWNVSEEGEGVCWAFCQGDEYECPADSRCNLTGDGVLTLCVPSCDPVLQDCLAGESCLYVGGSFSCVLDGSEGEGGYGADCVLAISCNPGLLCVDGMLVPECQQDGCCSPFCHLEEVDACPDQELGVSCIPFFEEGQADPGKEHVGICALD